MLMALGQFVFEINQLAYHELQRSTQWRHATTSRVGARPARQFVGPGDDTVQLTGVLVPELTGRRDSLDTLRAMGDAGDAYALVSGAGGVFGAWVIGDMQEIQSHFLRDGTPRRTQFTLTLERTDDAMVSSSPPGNGSAVRSLDSGSHARGDA